MRFSFHLEESKALWIGLKLFRLRLLLIGRSSSAFNSTAVVLYFDVVIINALTAYFEILVLFLCLTCFHSLLQIRVISLYKLQVEKHDCRLFSIMSSYCPFIIKNLYRGQTHRSDYCKRISCLIPWPHFNASPDPRHLFQMVFSGIALALEFYRQYVIDSAFSKHKLPFLIKSSQCCSIGSNGTK